MGSLIARNLLDVAVKGGVISSIGKVLLGKVGKTLHVELVLKVLEGQSIVEDDTVVDLRGALLNSRGGSDKAGSGEGKSCREVHFV